MTRKPKTTKNRQHTKPNVSPRVKLRPNYCPLFGINFNIMNGFFSTNRQPCRKKSILAKVGFDAKRG